MDILIADDDPVSRMVLRALIERLGHQVRVVSDGAAAWEAVQQRPPDVVISDWLMPDMDGLELCQRVRARKDLGYTYFILLTVLTGKKNFIAGIGAGADDYLVKPLDRQELQMRLLVAARVLSLHRQVLSQRARLDAPRLEPPMRVLDRLRLREDLELLQLRAGRHGATAAVVLAAIDDFDSYAEACGPLLADELRTRVLAAMFSHCRRGDQVYRLVDGQVVAVLPDQGEAAARATAARFCEAVARLGIEHPRRSEPVGLRVGVALIGRGASPDVVLAEAQADLGPAAGVAWTSRSAPQPPARPPGKSTVRL